MPTSPNGTLKALAPNQTQITYPSGYIAFYSYNTLVAVRHNASAQEWRTETKHSSTTTRHLNKWCSPSALPVPQNTLERILQFGYQQALAKQQELF